jgi:voltage-gated potassium channel
MEVRLLVLLGRVFDHRDFAADFYASEEVVVTARAEGGKPFVWDLLEPGARATPLERALHTSLLLLIVLNVAAVVLESVPACAVRYATAFRWFEYASVGVFSAEYLARVWSCTADPRYARPVVGRLRYALTPMALVDLAAILPTFLFFVHADLRVIRIFRLLRLARLAKVGRYSEAAIVLVRVLRAKREEMALTISLVVLLGIVFATLAYYAESTAQPDKFPDIPHALWWAFVTITTVGYGDVAPVTPVGKVIGVATALLGILMIALPTGVLGAAFVEELNRTAKKETRCPHCGKPL